MLTTCSVQCSKLFCSIHLLVPTSLYRGPGFLARRANQWNGTLLLNSCLCFVRDEYLNYKLIMTVLGKPILLIPMLGLVYLSAGFLWSSVDDDSPIWNLQGRSIRSGSSQRRSVRADLRGAEARFPLSAHLLVVSSPHPRSPCQDIRRWQPQRKTSCELWKGTGFDGVMKLITVYREWLYCTWRQ